MRIGSFAVWTSAQEAAGYGCTHHARIFGIIPGFIGECDGLPLWVPRTDALNWAEDALSFIAWLIAGDDGGTAFRIGKEINVR